MKKIIIIVLVLSSSVSFAQFSARNFNSFRAPNNPLKPVNVYTRVDYASILIPKKNPEIDGNVHAFKEWNNKGTLNVDKKIYRLNNINFNMRTNTIESKVGKDSLYIFDLSNVNYATINNRKFKSFYVTKLNKKEIFEVLYDGDDFSVLIGYEVGVKRGEVDPLMVQNKKAKYYTTKTYYIKKGTDVKKMVLKKKNVVSLFNDKSKLVNQFAKENKLSFKKDKDLKKIFNYYKSL